MPQVPGHERRRRAALLREKGAAALSGFLAGQVGNSSRVLLERPGQGRSEQFALIQLEQTATLPENGIVTVDIIEAAENHLIGRLAA